MRRWRFWMMGLIFIFAASIAFSHSGEKHEPAEKEKGAGMMHGKTKTEGDVMAVLHTSMEKLNELVEDIFHSIIVSDFSRLDSSAGTIRQVAEDLRVTRPHRNLVKIGEYRRLVAQFDEKCAEFEADVKAKDPGKIAGTFGSLVATCVECHVSFRDGAHENVNMTRHYRDSTFLITDGGHFSVEMITKGIDFQSPKSSVDVIIHDASDKDVEGGIVEAIVWTPERGIQDGEKLPVSELSGGRYRIKKLKAREGDWGLYVKVKKEAFVRADDVVDGVVFDFSMIHHGD